jgi:putative nucleotidyltransferase with HDIG domain
VSNVAPRTLRHTEHRRRLADGGSAWTNRFRALLRWPLVIAVAFWAVSSTTILSARGRLPYSLNQNVRQPVFARVNFERVNENRTAELRTKAQQEVPNFYRLNRALMDEMLSEIRDLHAAVKSADSFEKYQTEPTPRWPLDPSSFDALKAFADEEGSARFKKDLDTLAARLPEEEMVERADVEREVRSTAGEVQIDRGDGHFIAWPKEKLTYAVTAEHVDALADSVVRDLFVTEIRPVFRALIRRTIAPAENKPVRPLYVYDADYTKSKIDEAGALPPVRDSYRVGDRLVKPGLIDGEALALLKAEHEEFEAQRRTNAALRSGLIAERMGILGIVMIITVGLAVFTHRVQPKIVIRTPRAFAVAALLALMLLADRYLLTALSSSSIWTVAIVTMTAAILTISYSQLFALGVASALAILGVLAHNAGLGNLIVFLTVATVTVLLLREIRTRLKMVQVGGLTALASAVVMTCVGLTQQQSLRYIAREASFAALAALAGISIVLVLLPLIERAFRITTSLTLLEWADTSKHLLRQLIETAPGTWQHSHLLGSMAESAAEEIGANGLLVRVGAYYHDVGKMCKPNYFVENQQANMNAHRRLAPTMSLLVILAHVKDGLALAREHGLPPALHPFIAEHHGTTVVKYFHTMAAQEAKAAGRDDRPVSDTEFRYPGPKPRSVETAILMICDGVEGAVRSLSEPTPSRIETVVHDLIMERLMDGQFDDCDITLKELTRVEQSLVRSLCSIYHGRIAYPAMTDDASRPGDSKRPVRLGA